MNTGVCGSESSDGGKQKAGLLSHRSLPYIFRLYFYLVTEETRFYCFVSEAKSGEDLLLEECVLELLLAEDLSALLATANQIRHDLFCGAKRQILEDFEALRGNFRSHLV